MSMESHTGIVMPVRVWLFCAHGYYYIYIVFSCRNITSFDFCQFFYESILLQFLQNEVYARVRQRSPNYYYKKFLMHTHGLML